VTDKQTYMQVAEVDELAKKIAATAGYYSTGLEAASLAESSPEAVELLRKWLNFGWAFRLKRTGNKNLKKNKQLYIDRVESELDVIISKGFVDYFLVTSDIVRWAKDHKIPVGPARGSAAASVVCYLLRITEVDPIQHPHMLFERFIDPTREEAPDIDLDFDDENRFRVFKYAASKYGAANTGNIANFTRYRGKNSLDDVARAYKIPKWDLDPIKGLIIERSGGDSRLSDSLEDTFATFPAAQAVLDKHPSLANAVRLEGNYRGMGVHAAGLVISNEPINDYCATYTRQVAGREATVVAYDKKDAAYIGMLKQDILGLSTMGMIRHALDMIDMDLEDLYRVPLTDRKTLDAFKRNDVVGIFQFEGRATRLVCRDVAPDYFQHLADINALSRPGPLFSGMAAAYVEVKHGRKVAESYHPIVDEHTSYTYGQIIYQEQVLRIIRELGGFPMTRVHAIRQIISQKLGEAQFESMYAEFEEHACSQHGCTPAQARRIWRFMATSATYSFNIAHCISYSMLAFWQMWLKVHHPQAFYAAQLRKTSDASDPKAEQKRRRLLKDAAGHSVPLRPMNIEDCELSWSQAGDDGIQPGLTQIPGIGTKTADNIIDWMNEKVENDKRLRWDDIIEVKGIGPKTKDRIIAFTLDPDPFNMDRLSRVMRGLRAELHPGNRLYLPVPTHTSDTLPRDGTHTVTWAGIPMVREYKDLIEDERARSGKEVEEILAEIKDPHLLKSCVLKCIDDGDEEVYIRFSRWHFPHFAERIESLRLGGADAVIVRGIKRDGFGVSIQARELWAVELDG
jgi:DNA polymerase III subunit alpha